MVAAFRAQARLRRAPCTQLARTQANDAEVHTPTVCANSGDLNAGVGAPPHCVPPCPTHTLTLAAAAATHTGGRVPDCGAPVVLLVRRRHLGLGNRRWLRRLLRLVRTRAHVHTHTHTHTHTRRSCQSQPALPCSRAEVWVRMLLCTCMNVLSTGRWRDVGSFAVAQHAAVDRRWPPYSYGLFCVRPRPAPPTRQLHGLTIRHQHKPLQADAAGKAKQGDGGSGGGHEGARKPLLSHDDATTN